MTGIWPLVWDSQVKTPSAQKFTDAFTKKYGKPPENQAWGDYLSTKHVAQAMNEIKTTDSTQDRRAPGEGREVRRAEDRARATTATGTTS